MALTEKDRVDILELVARYSRGTDLRDPEIAEMFAENGVLEANGKVLGDRRAAIRAFLEAGRSAAQNCSISTTPSSPQRACRSPARRR